jgi:hypothetical protein
MVEKPLIAQGRLTRATPVASFRERLLNGLLGEKCPYCHERGIERGYWARGRNHLCQQASGDWGGYCKHCHQVSFTNTDEEFEAKQPEWCSLSDKTWDPSRPVGQQRIKKEVLDTHRVN